MKKLFLSLPPLLLLLLLFSSVKFSSAFRSHIMDIGSNRGSPSSSVSSAPTEVHLPQVQEDEEIGEYYMMSFERRMEMEESTDYPGTGANNHHDPKTPGRPF